MLFDVHARHLTPAMFYRDRHWGPNRAGVNLVTGVCLLHAVKVPAISNLGNSEPGGATRDRAEAA